MIIGNGLIGSTLRRLFKEHEDLLIFTSGVSNSKEKREEEYEREINLLKQSIKDHKNKKLIYFSSCSITKDVDCRYSRHKKYIEEYIQNNTVNYLILRLPNIIGKSVNKNQLVNYFYNCLVNQEKIRINTDCIRHLIDVEDLPKIIKVLKNINRTIINVAFNNGVTVDQIVLLLEDSTGIKFKDIEFAQEGNDYVIDNSTFLEYVNETDFVTKPEHIIRKYFKNEN